MIWQWCSLISVKHLIDSRDIRWRNLRWKIVQLDGFVTCWGTMYKDHSLKLTYIIFGSVLFNIFNYDFDKVIDDIKQHGDQIYQMMESMFRID